MQPLEPSDAFLVRAAEGWLGLGAVGEAFAELDRVSPAARRHPATLDARYLLLAHQRDWAAAAAVAHERREREPDHVAGWLHYAYAVRRQPGGGLPAAWAALQPALARFPEEPVVPYNLACYACQMNQLDTARELLRRACAHVAYPIRQMALADADLEPLWPEIRGW